MKFNSKVEDVQSFSNKCKTGDFACFYQNLSNNLYVFSSSLGNTNYVNFNLVGIANIKELDYASIQHVEIFDSVDKSYIFFLSKLKNGFELTLHTFDKTEKKQERKAK